MATRKILSAASPVSFQHVDTKLKVVLVTPSTVITSPILHTILCFKSTNGLPDLKLDKISYFGLIHHSFQ